MRYRAAAAALAIALAPASAAAQSVRIDATLSEDRVTVGQTTVLRVSAETDGETASIEVPGLPPQVIAVGTQDFTQLQHGADGARRVTRKDVILQAVAPGRITIQVLIHVNGRVYRPNDLSLGIEGPLPPPRPADAPPEVMLYADLTPDTVYVGDQVLLSAEALFAGYLRQRQTRPASYQAPSPTGFWVQDLDTPVVAGTRMIDGDVYESQTFRRIYFPLEAGTFTMEPARLVYELRRGLLQSPESRELASDPLRVVVRPLPAAGQPADFTGAVGDFQIDARLEPRTVAAGEAAVLTVELRGRGNIKALPPPRLPELEGAELFPPTEESQVRIEEGRVAGTKRFEWVIVPGREGRLEIGPLEYTFFDPVAERYGRSRTAALAITVTPAGRAPRDQAALAPIARVATDRTGGRPLQWVRSPAFLAAQLVPLLIVAGAGLAAKRRRHGAARSARRQRQRERLARFEALRARAAADGGAELFAELERTLRGAIANITGRAGEAPRAELVSAVAGLNPELAPALEALFSSIDRARFSPVPVTAVERTRLVAEAGRLVERIARAAARIAAPQAGSARMVALVVAAGCAMAGAAPLAAQPTGDTNWFTAGIAAYDAGDFEAAIEAFNEHVRERPFDAAAWSNLGSAYSRAAQPGVAAWAWLRALALEPRRADARHNLRVAGGPAAALVPPAFALTGEEAVLVIAALWWAGALAIAAGWLRQPMRRAILIAAVVLAGAAAGAAMIALPGGTAIVLHEQTPILAGPALKADPVASLPVASPVRVIEARGGWTRVRTFDRVEGWIETALLGRI